MTNPKLWEIPTFAGIDLVQVLTRRQVQSHDYHTLVTESLPLYTTLQAHHRDILRRLEVLKVVRPSNSMQMNQLLNCDNYDQV